MNPPSSKFKPFQQFATKNKRLMKFWQSTSNATRPYSPYSPSNMQFASSRTITRKMAKPCLTFFFGFIALSAIVEASQCSIKGEWVALTLTPFCTVIFHWFIFWGHQSLIPRNLNLLFFQQFLVDKYWDIDVWFMHLGIGHLGFFFPLSFWDWMLGI